MVWTPMGWIGPPEKEAAVPPPKKCADCGAFFPQQPKHEDSYERSYYDPQNTLEILAPVVRVRWSCSKCGWVFRSGTWPREGESVVKRDGAVVEVATRDDEFSRVFADSDLEEDDWKLPF